MKMSSLIGEVAGEELSDPERRSSAVSRLLSMASKVADCFSHGRVLGMLVSIMFDELDLQLAGILAKYCGTI